MNMKPISLLLIVVALWAAQAYCQNLTNTVGSAGNRGITSAKGGTQGMKSKYNKNYANDTMNNTDNNKSWWQSNNDNNQDYNNSNDYNNKNYNQNNNNNNNNDYPYYQ